MELHSRCFRRNQYDVAIVVGGGTARIIQIDVGNMGKIGTGPSSVLLSVEVYGGNDLELLVEI
jgi:hypothetical protein